jgi:hypothetical protein
LLILSVIHVPLPLADYHNIRHHDRPGEICPYHDHLLRWHPTANWDADVSIFHWHWFVPVVSPGQSQQAGDDEGSRPVRGPVLHAQVGDWPEPDWTGEPVIRPDSRGRLLELVNLGLAGKCSACASGLMALVNPEPRPSAAGSSGGPGGFRAARLAQFQRWNC